MSNAPATGSLIGPNSITRVAEALRESADSQRAAALFGAAGLSHYLERPPEHMVEEQDVLRLHCALRANLPAPEALAVFRSAGARTAAYLLAHRIPRPVQALLRVLPARAASRILLTAITRHAWTFAGSGTFTAEAGKPVLLRIGNNPLCRGVVTEKPACDYYAATFEGLYRVLVNRNARVTELECEAAGAAECIFRIDW